jgi:hypothetical protein
VAQPTTAQFLASFVIGTAVGIAVFLHADRNGSKHTTAWGIVVFLAAPIGLPVYLIHVFRARRSRSGE